MKSDYVKTEIPFPDSFTAALQFKDFDCLMTKLLIRGDGCLLIEEKEIEQIQLSERPNPNHHVLWRLIGNVNSTHHGLQDFDFHGDVILYGHKTDPNGEPYDRAQVFLSVNTAQIRVYPK